MRNGTDAISSLLNSDADVRPVVSKNDGIPFRIEFALTK